MIEFVESTHTYLLNGVIIPSVSTLLKATIFKDKYKDVDPIVLQNAAQFGKNVHKAIETGFDIFLTDMESVVFNRYKHLIAENDIIPIEHEKIVYTEDYAGTFDLLAKVGTFNSLVDIKTTYQLDYEYLSYQLSYYEKAYCELFNKPKFDKLYCIWLPKRKEAKLVEIERIDNEELERIIKIYKETE